MSAPIVTCELLDAAGPLLRAAGKALGAKVTVEYFDRGPLDDGFYCVVIFDADRAFQGLDDTPTRALLKANGERQTFLASLRKPQTPSSSSLHTPVEDRGRDGLVSVKSEHRLSGERPFTARADHAAGSRSSDGSDAISATDAPSSIDTPPAGAVRGAASANQDDA